MNGEVKSFNPEEITSPRLVYMKRGDQGYGFNLHGEKGVQGQTISAVDKGSPAEVGGLREGDRVIEVNGVNVEMKKHGEVVGLIKQNANETRLLVIDSITDKYLKEKQRPITEDMANLKTVYEAPQPTLDQQPTPEVELEVKQSESDETQVEVDATPTQNGDEPGAGQCEEPEVVQPPSQPEPEPEPTPEVQQDDSPKDAIDQINNVLEQEEKQPVHVAAPDPEPTPEPAVLEKEVTQPVPVAAPNPEPDIFRNIDPASAKPTKKRNKKEGMGWEEKKKWFDGL